MLDKAFNNRNLEGLIFHSDQGWQYQHNSYQSRLKEKGIKIALGSDSKNAPLILGRLEISGYFDTIVDGSQVSKAKPDPEVFIRAAG